MQKGEQTRKDVLDRAFALAGELGLEALSLGVLAASAGLSKSGLFAHFKSKEALQLAVIEEARERFSAIVAKPALKAPRGEKRVRALFDRFMVWKTENTPPGCIFTSLSQEYDDRPGPVRDRLVEAQEEWNETIRRVAQTAVESGEFRKGLDLDVFVFAFHGVTMAHQYVGKLLRHPRTDMLARQVFESLIQSSRSSHTPS